MRTVGVEEELLLVDPDTQLLTGVYNEGVTREQHLQVITLELTEEAMTYLANAGYDPNFGARPPEDE